MLPQFLSRLATVATWKAALLALLAAGALVLPSPVGAQRAGQSQGSDHVIVMLWGTGDRITDRAQTGDRCTPGKRSLVHATIEDGAGGGTITATARCVTPAAGAASAARPAQDAAARCSVTRGRAAADTCRTFGDQPAGGPTPQCDAAYARGQASGPDSSWRVTCIFNLR